ncbi:MAG: HAMP domain-containing sensor histidine kinase [Verrucomicrobiae bacterium]|nr:HAMP domain-containing sensor histidine kinase [Verrucomicrobiae bacterium]
MRLPSLSSPLVGTLVLSLFYLFFSAGWVILSTQFSSDPHLTTGELIRLEMIKGLVFCGVSTLLIAGLSYGLLHMISLWSARQTRQEALLRQAEKHMETCELAASIAHDCNNVLSMFSMGVDLLRGTLENPTPGQKKTLDNLGHGASRMNELIHRLSEMGRPEQDVTKETILLRDFTHNLVEVCRAHPRLSQSTLSLTGTLPKSFRGSSSLLYHMLLNLILNAADAAGPGGRIELEIRETTHSMIFQVSDNGPGIPPDQRDSIFQPFFTTKPNGKGLGLLSVKSFAKTHQGTVEISDSPLGGAFFRVITKK